MCEEGGGGRGREGVGGVGGAVGGGVGGRRRRRLRVLSGPAEGPQAAPSRRVRSLSSTTPYLELLSNGVGGAFVSASAF